MSRKGRGKKVYFSRVEQRVCVKCGVFPAREGKVVCCECAKKQKEISRRWRDSRKTSFRYGEISVKKNKLWDLNYSLIFPSVTKIK